MTTSNAIGIDAKSRGAFTHRGDAYYAIGKYVRAIADYNVSIGLGSQVPSTFVSRGNAYYKSGNYGRAIADYDQALRLNSKLLSAFEGRSKADLKNRMRFWEDQVFYCQSGSDKTAYARASGPPKCGVQNGNTEVRSLPV